MPSLDGHSCILWRQYGIVFGGKDSVTGTFVQHTWRIDLSQESPARMEILNQSGSIPPVRAYHAACNWSKYMVIHGGLTKPCQIRDPENLYLLDCDAHEWLHRHTTGSIPSARVHHTLSTRGEALYLYGGFPDSGSYSDTLDQANLRPFYDVYTISMQNCVWRVIQTSLAPPPMLWGHGSALVSESLVVYGGVETVKGTESGSICMFHLEKGQWRWIDLPNSPKARALHATVLYNGNIVIFGGMSGVNQAQLNDVWFFSCNEGQWLNVETFGGTPPPRSGHAMIVYNHKLFVLGGVDATNRPNSRLYMLNLKTHHWSHCDPVFECPAKTIHSKLSFDQLPQPQLFKTSPTNLRNFLTEVSGESYSGPHTPVHGMEHKGGLVSGSRPYTGTREQEINLVCEHIEESIARARNLLSMSGSAARDLLDSTKEVERKLNYYEVNSLWSPLWDANSPHIRPLMADEILDPLPSNHHFYMPQKRTRSPKRTGARF